MIAIRVYRLALRMLPTALRRKHGPAMEELFSRDVDDALARGRLHGALAGVAGVLDVVTRAAYEQMRPDCRTTHESLPMPLPTARQFLGRHAATFTIAFVLLTASMLFLFGSRQIPAMSAV